MHSVSTYLSCHHSVYSNNDSDGSITGVLVRRYRRVSLFTVKVSSPSGDSSPSMSISSGRLPDFVSPTSPDGRVTPASCVVTSRSFYVTAPSGPVSVRGGRRTTTTFGPPRHPVTASSSRHGVVGRMSFLRSGVGDTLVRVPAQGGGSSGSGVLSCVGVSTRSPSRLLLSTGPSLGVCTVGCHS